MSNVRNMKNFILFFIIVNVTSCNGSNIIFTKVSYLYHFY